MFLNGKQLRIPGLPGLLPALVLISLCSCSGRLGWGILLWSATEPPVPSGTVLPVYIRSNIDHVWVVGIPEEYREKIPAGANNALDKFEVPLPKLELVGSKEKAKKRAEAFSSYALTYAETLQDGLPIRETPDNSGKRVYRLKEGEIVKVLSLAKGVAAVGADGNPLPGDWLRVLTEDGNTGYCFSYRLKLFEHSGGPLVIAQAVQEEKADPGLERLLAKTWSPESYGTMVSSRRIKLEDLSRRWSFDPGAETGTARIKIAGLDRSFSHRGIRAAGERAWRFEGTELQMSLRSDNSLVVQFPETGGSMRTLAFVALSAKVDDIAAQESRRREELFINLYSHGPAYSSNNYGTLSFGGDGSFTWTDYNLLIPQVIPVSAIGSGTASMGIFLAGNLENQYTGAFTLYFDGLSGPGYGVNFLYTLEAQGLRLEYVPAANIEDVTVTRRSSSPTEIYFYREDYYTPE